ncbi:MAG: 6-phosphofructokinase [Dehalococcoidia bacterium]|jgi:6-phosphofructokinase 1
MKTIAVLASGGDSPGMNACIRAVVRAGAHRGLETFGVKDGYLGLLAGAFTPLHRHDVSNIIQRGGVILGASRCPEFTTPEGRAKGAAVLRATGIDGLIAIGGDGTLRGAKALAAEQGIPVILAPGTIDNDVPGTDFTIGFDTAVNTAVEAVDRLRDTAEATERVFFVEVMGRESGTLALHAGLAAGADAILVPELRTDIDELVALLNRAILRHSRSLIVVIAEGDCAGGAFTIAEQVHDQIKRDYRVTVLGHVQRGGTPTARDRVLATRLGIAATQALIDGKGNHIVGEMNGAIRATPFDELGADKRLAPLALLELLPELV